MNESKIRDPRMWEIWKKSGAIGTVKPCPVESERQLNSGEMPHTDFHYEEFEGLLGSYYLTMRPLRNGPRQDQTDFGIITGILNGFARRHGVRMPKEAVVRPRPTKEEWGQPAIINSCFSIVDLMGSFWRDFGVGGQPGTVDEEERRRLGRLMLGVLHRYGVIEAGFEEINGKQTPVRILREDREKFFRPLQEVIKAR